MGNNPPQHQDQPSPPKYEESTSTGLVQMSIDLGCRCHNNYAILKATVEELATHTASNTTSSPGVASSTASSYSEWEHARIRGLLGVIWGSTGDCAIACLCHEDYECLAKEIKALYGGIGEMSAELKKQKRMEGECKSWERHVGDIRFLDGMLRDCKMGERDEVGRAVEKRRTELKEIRRELKEIERRVGEMCVVAGVTGEELAKMV